MSAVENVRGDWGFSNGALFTLQQPVTTTDYRYSLNYQPNSNIGTYNDLVMGPWTVSYDGLNRLAGSVGRRVAVEGQEVVPISERLMGGL